MEINEEVKEFILKKLNVPNIGIDESLLRHGVNSLNFINLIVELEEKFEIEFDDEAFLIENVDTINKIINLVNNKN